MDKENPLLSQAAQDVPAPSSEGTDPVGTDNNQDDLNSATPVPGQGQKPGDADEGTSDGRPLENLKREVDRKLNQISKIEGRIEAMLSQLQSNQQPAAPAGPKSIESMTAAELESLAGSIPEDRKAAFMELLAQKKTEEQVKSTVRIELERANFESERKAANQEAFGKFPELRQPGSMLRIETNRVLDEMGRAADADKKALLHAAEAAAARLGIAAKRYTPASSTASGGTAPANSGGEPESMDVETAQSIAARLSAAMPGGKFSKESIDSARKNTAVYKKHASNILRG